MNIFIIESNVNDSLFAGLKNPHMRIIIDLIIHAYNGWTAVSTWRARHQFRWNKDEDEMSVKDIIAFVMARVGLKLEVKSQSSVITGFYTDFTIHRNNRGETVIARLMSFVPDMLFIEGNRAYIINPRENN